MRLAWFFTRLGVKERVAPRLHVRPLVAELFLTENCNLRCISCNCWRENTQQELTTDEWKSVLRQLAALRIYKANFTGGEPLIRPDAIELLGYAHGQGVQHLHLNTNGIRLDPAAVTKTCSMPAYAASTSPSTDRPGWCTTGSAAGSARSTPP